MSLKRSSPSRPLYHHNRAGMGIRLAFILCWAIILAYGIATILVPPRHDPVIVRGIGVLMALVSGFFLVRSFRAATIDVYLDKIVVRRLVWTSKFALSDVAGFIAVPKANLWGIRGNAL